MFLVMVSRKGLNLKRHAGLSAPRFRAFFFGADRDRRGGWLSIAARKIRLMRVW